MSITTSPNDLLRQRALKGQRLLNLTLSGMFIYCLVLAPWYDSWSTALLWDQAGARWRLGVAAGLAIGQTSPSLLTDCKPGS